MKTIGAAEFKAHCLRIMDEVGPEGIVITKRGKPVAKLLPADELQSMKAFIGILAGRVFIDGNENPSTAGAWDNWTSEDQEEK